MCNWGTYKQWCTRVNKLSRTTRVYLRYFWIKNALAKEKKEFVTYVMCILYGQVAVKRKRYKRTFEIHFERRQTYKTTTRCGLMDFPAESPICLKSFLRSPVPSASERIEFQRFPKPSSCAVRGWKKTNTKKRLKKNPTRLPGKLYRSHCFQHTQFNIHVGDTNTLCVPLRARVRRPRCFISLSLE